MEAIKCSGITQTFGSVRAVDNVDLTVPAGSVTALLGPNGAGKSTLLDVALGLTRARAGEAKIFGMPPREALRRGYVGVAQQNLRLPAGLTVAGALRSLAALWRHHLPLNDLIEWAQLGALRERRVAKLSGGERQRLLLAIAMLPNPRLLVLDEPTAGMDVNARHRFWDSMAQLPQRTIVFATHYLEEAQMFADRTVIMGQGRILAEGPTAQIRHRALAHLTAEVPEAARAQLAHRLAATNPDWQVSFDPGGIRIRGSQLTAAARIVLEVEGVENLTLVPASLDEAFRMITEAK